MMSPKMGIMAVSPPPRHYPKRPSCDLCPTQETPRVAGLRESVSPLSRPSDDTLIPRGNPKIGPRQHISNPRHQGGPLGPPVSEFALCLAWRLVSGGLTANLRS